MKNSRTSLNKPFYDWIKEVREADKKIEELEDKLYYYNVKLIGYSSPNFEPRLSSTKPEYKDNRYIWINKIVDIENKIKVIKQLKIEYKRFESYLNPNQVKLLKICLDNERIAYGIARNVWYNNLNLIARLYLSLKL